MRRKKNFRKKTLKEAAMDKISDIWAFRRTGITDKLYKRHPDLEQAWTPVTSSTRHHAEHRGDHKNTDSHGKLTVISTFMYISLSI